MRIIPIVCAFLLLLPAAIAQEEGKEAKPSKTVVTFRPQGTYLDLPELGVGLEQLLSGGGPKPKAFFELKKRLDAVPTEHESAELLLDLTAPHAFNFAQMAELHRSFDALRAAGVRTTAFVENANTPQLLLASACDRILVADVGMITALAPSMQVMHLKDAMDLLGIEMQATRAGRFKGAVEPYVLSRMSSHLREHYAAMLDSVNGFIVKRLAERRGLTEEKVRAAQRKGILSAPEALEAGLVDAVVAWRGARAALGYKEGEARYVSLEKKKEKKGFNIFKLLSSAGNEKKQKVDEASIAVLHLSGAISDGLKKVPGSIVSGPTVKEIEALQADEKVKAVLVRINSPGGSGSASEAILLALRDLAKSKPVAVSMGDVAASGGYYVAMIGCPVWAEHATITGSIGVFGMRPNFERLAARIGVRNELVALDDVAALNDPFHSLQGRHLDRIQSYVDHFYDRFLQRILEVRGLEKEQLLELAGGRVWSGEQALAAGLVDHVGGSDHALAWLRQKAGGENLPVVHFPAVEDNPFAILEQMFGAQADLEERLRILARRGYDVGTLLSILDHGLRHPARPLIMARLPFDLVLR